MLILVVMVSGIPGVLDGIQQCKLPKSPYSLNVCLGFFFLSCLMLVFWPCFEAGEDQDRNTREMVPSDRFPRLSSTYSFCWQDICKDLREKAMMESTISSPCAEWKDSVSVAHCYTSALINLFLSRPKPPSCPYYIHASFLPDPILD